MHILFLAFDNFVIRQKDKRFNNEHDQHFLQIVKLLILDKYLLFS